MARPPIFPVNINGVNKNYFEILIEQAEPYLKEDNIILNITGYSETIEEYNMLNLTDIKTVERLSIELNGWSEYMSTLANIIQNNYLDSETDKIKTQSQKSIDYNEKNVSAGERYANTTDEVIYIRKKRNALKSLYEELISKTKFLERAHYHCKSICDWNYRSNQSYVKQI